MPLELQSLRNATTSLGQALQRSEDPTLMGGMDETLRTVVQSGVIKHFEFTYELCWKFIKRWLEENVNRTVADGVTRRELFRLGAEQRLIDDVDRWMDHHEARNQTSHTYRKATADRVYAAIPAFLDDARLLLAALEARND
jgi:nucleotidyltransferase substrate binding protein (TIGR01987 family)